MDDKDMTASILTDGLPKILPPYENGVFQAILTLPEAYAALVGTVATYIELPVKSVTLRNNDAPARDRKAKREQYDINCSVDIGKGDQCNLEIQANPMKGDSNVNEHRNIRWRSVYNLCHLHANQPGRGVRYGNFVRSYQIMLCHYKVFAFDNQLVERFTFRNQRGNELCEATTSIFVDLTMAKEIANKPVAEMSDAEAWSVFFSLGNDPRYNEVIVGLTKMEEGIAVAYNALLNISQDADERARFHSRMMWLQDREHEQAVAREEGFEKGREEGLEKGREYTRAEYKPLIALKDAEIANKDAEIEALRERIRMQEGQ